MGIDSISCGQDEVLFVKAETALGTLVYAAGTDIVPIITEAVFEQAITTIPDPQKKITIDELTPLTLGYPPGTFSFTMLIKPSGVLGTAYKGQAIIEAGFGEAAVNGGVSIIHNLGGINDDVMGLSFIHRYGHMVTWNSGCIVDKMVFPIKADQSQEAKGQVQISGTFCKQVMAGYSYVNPGQTGKYTAGFGTDANPVVVGDYTQFEVGSKVRFRLASTGAVEQDATTGYTVTKSVVGGLSLDPVLAGDVQYGDIIDGFTPTVSDGGTTVYGRLGSAQEIASGGSLADVLITDASVEMTLNVKLKDNEKTGSLYPATAIKAQRQIRYNCNQIFLKGSASKFAEARARSQKHISLPVGDTAAFRYCFDFPYVVFDTPKRSGSDEINLARTGKVLASTSYDDSATLTFA